jgi:hypothetical protein
MKLVSWRRSVVEPAFKDASRWLRGAYVAFLRLDTPHPTTLPVRPTAPLRLGRGSQGAGETCGEPGHPRHTSGRGGNRTRTVSAALPCGTTDDAYSHSATRPECVLL